MACVFAVCASQERALPTADIGQGELRAGYGLVGDAHAGLGERQVSLLALESIEQANREHGIEARPGSFAENLTTLGLDLLALGVGDRLRVGPALLEVVQIGKPPEAAHTYSFQGVSILPRLGVFCRVLEGGRVARGDAIVAAPGEASISYRAIGRVESPRREPGPPEALRQVEARIVLHPALTEGLQGLTPGQELVVLFHFHRSRGYELCQHPRGDVRLPKQGVFSLRSPRRPNPIGLTRVELVAIEGNVLRVRGLDAIDGTPVLDLKPA